MIHITMYILLLPLLSYSMSFKTTQTYFEENVDKYQDDLNRQYLQNGKNGSHNDCVKINSTSKLTSSNFSTSTKCDSNDLNNTSTTQKQANWLKDLVETSKKHVAYIAGVAIHVYWVPIIVVFGTIGNSLSLAVMLQKHNREISCCVYMSGLAVTDNLLLGEAAYYWATTVPFFKV